MTSILFRFKRNQEKKPAKLIIKSTLYTSIGEEEKEF